MRDPGRINTRRRGAGRHAQMARPSICRPFGPLLATVCGTNGRYRVEARHVYGEGFKHLMAARSDCRDRAKTVVYYRNVCTENEHPHRQCPLSATVANVLSLDDVLVIMMEYWTPGELSDKFDWDDHTSE